MTARDNEILRHLEPEKYGFLIASYAEGYFINVATDASSFETDLEAFAELGMSKAFIKMLKEARTQGIPLLRFDCEAAEVKGAKHHDW